jgi:hypothetical protein
MPLHSDLILIAGVKDLAQIATRYNTILFSCVHLYLSYTKLARTFVPYPIVLSMQLNLSTVIYSLGLSLLLSLSWACQKEPATETTTPRYFAHLDVRYLAPSQELRGQAIFTEGDSAVNATPLSVPGGAAFMGSGMTAKKLFDDRIRYQATLQTDYPDSLRFRFRASEENPWEETALQLSPVDSFRVITASKQNGISVVVSASVGLEERLVLLFTDPNGEARTVVRLGPLSDNTIFVPAQGLEKYVTGDYSLYVVKIKDGTFQQGEWSVNQHLEYYTAAQNFTLAD